MKEKTLFVCEICNTQYSDKADAVKCEKSHKSPVEIGKCRYAPVTVNATGYPNEVRIKFSDGETIAYKR